MCPFSLCSSMKGKIKQLNVKVANAKTESCPFTALEISTDK